MIPNALLDRLIEQALRHKQWVLAGDLLYLKDKQETQQLLWDIQDSTKRLCLQGVANEAAPSQQQSNTI